MIRWLSSALSLLLVTLVSVQALACPPDVAKASLAKARAGVVAMLDADASKYGALETEIAEASTVVDAALITALADAATTPDQAKLYAELKTTWTQFKQTRDAELIPLLKAGKKDDAKALATGVQAERFKKMNELLTTLGAK